MSVSEEEEKMGTDTQTLQDDQNVKSGAGRTAQRYSTHILSSSSRSHVAKGKGLGMAGMCL